MTLALTNGLSFDDGSDGNSLSILAVIFLYKDSTPSSIGRFVTLTAYLAISISRKGFIGFTFFFHPSYFYLYRKIITRANEGNTKRATQ